MENQAARFFAEWPERMQKAKVNVPDVVKGFGALFASAMKSGELSVRDKELIAMSVAMALRCEPCLNVHVQKCLEAGATRQQVLEAASVVVMMQGGPGYTALPKVVEVLDAVEILKKDQS
jgi:AhpD family alkylhydroperoxidase